jgi:Kef-type K+ transport system membrane component KefB
MTASTTTQAAIIFVDLAVIVATSAGLGEIAARCRQPPVIGEIIAGILLGPTLLGALPGHLTSRLFPLQDRPFLSMLASLGLAFFMFTVGFELDHAHIRQMRSATAVSLGSVALPFAAGAGLALLLYPASHIAAGRQVAELPFVLFFGVAMSITAFPVLARILTSLDLHRSQLGTFVMACAAGADVTAWGVLSFVVAVAVGSGTLHAAVLLAELLGFALVLLFGIRPLMRAALTSRLAARNDGKLPQLLVIVGLMLSAWVTTRLGFQPVFGSFAFGAIIPKDAILKAAPEVPLLIEQAGKLLVPVFFVTTGLSVDLSSLGAGGYLEALLLIAVACAGKFGGSAGAALLVGFDRRRSAAIGVLMNSRGLTELVVLQVGVSLRILNERLAAMMILMAIVTTVAATPVFRRVYAGRLEREDSTEPSPAQGAPAS